MAGSYILPQTRVFQEFARTPNDVTQNLNPFVIGPNFQLIRYAREDERGDCATADYDGKLTTIEWAAGALGTTVDKSWCGVTFADAYVKLGTTPALKGCLDVVENKGTRFEFTPDEGKALAGSTDSSKLQFGVPVKVGDYLAYVDGTTKRYTRIRDISIGTPEDGEVTATIRKKGSTTNIAASILVVGVTGYTGEKPVTVYVTVSDSGQKITWRSSIAEINKTEKQTLSTTAVDLGLGLTLRKGSATTAVTDGDYVLAVTVSESYRRDTVTVSDIVPVAPAGGFTFVRKVGSIEAQDDDLSVAATGVTVAAGARVDIGASALYEVYAATAYLDQRNLRTDHTDSVYSVRTDSDIASELGAYDTPDNPLAYALHVMLLNNANRAIKFIALESDDMDGYTKALKRASVTTEVYAFCPLTEDKAIINAVVADCNRLSAPEEKSWRIAFFSMPTPETVDVTPEVDGVAAECKVSSTGVLTCYDPATVASGTPIASTSARFTETVRAGDVVTVIVAATPVDVVVTAVQSNNTLKLADKVEGAADAFCRFRVTHTRPRGEYVEAIAETSANFRDRRAYNVFPNTLRASDGNLVPGMYGAAAVCALACSVAPQQPITNVEIKGFSDLPDVYSKFSRDELNEIAAGGTLILMQEKPGGTVYVRHQISTAYRDGNLNTTELSLVKNLDSISYYFANRTAPYIGRYNITDDLIAEIRGVLEDGITHLETTTEASRLVGPQLLAEGTEIRSLYRSAEKDKLYANVALNLPAPFNNFDLHLQVI